MADPKTDDFRFERNGSDLTVVFTPTGASYTFPVDQSKPTAEQKWRADTGEYAESEVRKMAIKLAALAHQRPTESGT